MIKMNTKVQFRCLVSSIVVFSCNSKHNINTSIQSTLLLEIGIFIIEYL